MNNVQLFAMSKKVLKKSKRGKYQVVLHNDNHNTFEYVIDCLMEACGHNSMQAHQCALIVHNALRCVVFVDSYEQSEIIYKYLIKSKLTATIEKHVKQTP